MCADKYQRNSSGNFQRPDSVQLPLISPTSTQSVLVARQRGLIESSTILPRGVFMVSAHWKSLPGRSTVESSPRKPEPSIFQALLTCNPLCNACWVLVCLKYSPCGTLKCCFLVSSAGLYSLQKGQSVTLRRAPSCMWNWEIQQCLQTLSDSGKSQCCCGQFIGVDWLC